MITRRIIIIKLSKTNCYLLSLDDGFLLIDTGYESDRTLFFQSLKQNNITPEEIRFLFLTHHHDDHSGLVNDLLNFNPGLKLILHAQSVKYLASGINARDLGGVWCNKRMEKAAGLYRKINKNWTLSFPPYIVREADILLTNEDLNLEKILGGKLISVYSPGHTTDSLSLLDENVNLFCGDAAADYLRILGTRYAPPFITDMEQFYLTWQKFIDMGVKMIYPAHGKPFSINKLVQNIHKLSSNKTKEFVWKN